MATVTFVGGAIFGLAFAQRKGSDFRSRLYKGIKKGSAYNVLSEEFSGVSKDIWQTALGVKDSKEVQQLIGDSQVKLKEMGDSAKKYGGDVAKVLGKRYEELAKDLSKQAKDLKKSAEKKIKKTVKKAAKKTKSKVKKK